MGVFNYVKSPNGGYYLADTAPASKPPASSVPASLAPASTPYDTFLANQTQRLPGSTAGNITTGVPNTIDPSLTYMGGQAPLQATKKNADGSWDLSSIPATPWAQSLQAQLAQQAGGAAGSTSGWQMPAYLQTPQQATQSFLAAGGVPATGGTGSSTPASAWADAQLASSAMPSGDQPPVQKPGVTGNPQSGASGGLASKPPASGATSTSGTGQGFDSVGNPLTGGPGASGPVGTAANPAISPATPGAPGVSAGNPWQTGNFTPDQKGFYNTPGNEALGWAAMSNTIAPNQNTPYAQWVNSQYQQNYNRFANQSADNHQLQWTDFMQGMAPHMQQTFGLQSPTQRGENPLLFNGGFAGRFQS